MLTLLPQESRFTNQKELILAYSVYLIIYVLEPPLFRPSSEKHDHGPIVIYTCAGFAVLAMAFALGSNQPAFAIFRLIAGISRSSPITIVPTQEYCTTWTTLLMYKVHVVKVDADLYLDPVTHSRVRSVSITATTFGPFAGPSVPRHFLTAGRR